jgi:hypothetical protein
VGDSVQVMAPGVVAAVRTWRRLDAIVNLTGFVSILFLLGSLWPVGYSIVSSTSSLQAKKREPVCSRRLAQAILTHQKESVAGGRGGCYVEHWES